MAAPQSLSAALGMGRLAGGPSQIGHTGVGEGGGTTFYSW